MDISTEPNDEKSLSQDKKVVVGEAEICPSQREPSETSSWSEADTINMADEAIITFNVGGVIFQTLESTLRYPKRPVFRLRDMETLERHWDEERAMYFFDRDPAAFQTVLNYMRTGVLHLPHNMCSPQVTTELLYWGLPRIDIQPCCWKDYSVGIQSLENLRKLEKDRRPAYSNPDYIKQQAVPETTWGRIKANVWNVVSDPSSSKVAKVYGSISLFFIVISLINFAMSTVVTEDEENESRAEHPLPPAAKTINSSRRVYQSAIEEKEFIEYVFKTHSSGISTAISFIDKTCFVFFLGDLLTHLLSVSNLRTYLLSSQFWIDLLAIVPDVLLLWTTVAKALTDDVFHINIQVFYLLRFMRLFRVFRLMIRVTGVMTILYTLWASSKEILSLILVLLVCTLIFSSVVFYAENAEGNPDMSSVFDTCWWGIITLTTVGYGDVVPISVLGKTVGALCAFSGVILLGITVPTMVVNFITFNNLIQYMQEREMIFLYRVKGDYSKIPNIPCPDWL